MNNQAYADFLLSLIQQLQYEDAQRNVLGNYCYICNVLYAPLVSTAIPHPGNWKIENAQHIHRLMDAIHRKLQRFNRQSDVLNHTQFKAHTLSLPLSLQYPGASHLERRCRWLNRLAKYHSPIY